MGENSLSTVTLLLCQFFKSDLSFRNRINKFLKLKATKIPKYFLILVWKCNGLKEISYATPINKIYNIIIRKSNLIKK